MKEKRLKIIIGLMTFAVIGLIAVQIYWLTSLIKVESEKFDRTVISSLSHVSSKLEKDEAAKTVFNRMILKENNESGKKHKITVTSGNLNFLIQDSLSKTHFVQMINDDEMKCEYIIDSSNGKNISHIKVYNYFPNQVLQKKIVGNGIFLTQKMDTLVRSKKKLVQNVVTEMMEHKTLQPIEKRVSKVTLNNLLSGEFRNKGIDGDFYFGVNKVRNDSLTLLKSGTDPQKLKHSEYRTLLFPEEFFGSPNELIVYFPNKNRYILGSILGMLGLSIGFIVLIVGVFYKTVQMFIRQKKITEVKNDLINNISHEFKTPISTISLACEALIEPLLSAEKQSVARYSKIIKEENDRLQMMVDTLLNTAAMERDELKIANEKVHIGNVIDIAIQKFDESLKQKDGEIYFENNFVNEIVIGDKFHLVNVISNLIDNAIKYNEKKPIIRIIAKNSEGKAEISIHDNGIGIPKESIHKIFETFYRVQSGNIQNFRGNGIGLSYSKKIIELHQGTINVTSEMGIGTTFLITLPTV